MFLSILTILVGFDPQALTSLTMLKVLLIIIRAMFRSTGSYEPDPWRRRQGCCRKGFDPQALTSLTANDVLVLKEALVSIHRLLRA